METVAKSPDGFGPFLRNLRTSRKVSLSSVAGKAGVAKSTLSKWETNRFLPRLPEIDAVLAVLAASPEERRQAIQLIDAPRALIHLRREDQSAANEAAIDFASAPAGGDLLRAMRLRRGYSAEQVAHSLDVSIRSIHAWERSGAWPTSEHLHALCYLLEAAPEELAALLISGPWLPLPTVAPSASRDEVLSYLEKMYASAYDPAVESLRDLTFLAIEAMLIPRAVKSGALRLVLADVYTAYALWLGEKQRYQESAQHGERALELIRWEPHRYPQRLRAAIPVARSLAFSRGRGSAISKASQGSQFLHPFLDSDSSVGDTEYSRSHEAWAMSEIAAFLMIEGKNEMALELSARSVPLVEGLNRGHETQFRRFDWADNLLKSGYPEKALSVLPPWDSHPSERPSVRIRELLVRANAFQQTGNISESSDALSRAYEIAHAHHLDTQEIDALARQQG